MEILQNFVAFSEYMNFIKGSLILEDILTLVLLPTKDVKSLSWAENLNKLYTTNIRVGNSNFQLRKVIWHFSLAMEGTKVKIPSEIKPHLKGDSRDYKFPASKLVKNNWQPTFDMTNLDYKSYIVCPEFFPRKICKKLNESAPTSSYWFIPIWMI